MCNPNSTRIGGFTKAVPCVPIEAIHKNKGLWLLFQSVTCSPHGFALGQSFETFTMRRPITVVTRRGIS